MTKRSVCCVLIVLLCCTGSALAQEPLLQRGTKELSLSGLFDFQNEGDALIDIRAAYGFFPRDYLEVGGLVQIAGDFDDTFRYELGGFMEYHFIKWAFLRAPRAVPYLGTDLSLSFVDSDITEDNAALIFRPRVGVKWFIRDYFAIDTSLFVAVATDDLFPNGRNDLDPYDVGIRLGIRIHFK
ncbi:MAG TPA: hypothetical protein VIH59_35915 [Candidatus Tectomicrobia bacterium]|jgi:hypothetical protein